MTLLIFFTSRKEIQIPESIKFLIVEYGIWEILVCGIWNPRLFTIYKKIPEILVWNFWSVRTVPAVYHLPKISGLSRRARLNSSCNIKLVRNSRNL